MSHCGYMRLCPILDAESSVSAADMENYRRKYCQADKLACARYLVAISVGREKVPADLEPHESARALNIVRAAT